MRYSNGIKPMTGARVSRCLIIREGNLNGFEGRNGFISLLLRRVTSHKTNYSISKLRVRAKEISDTSEAEIR